MAPGRPGNLWEPIDGVGGRDYGAHGEFDDRSHHMSPELWCSHHARMLSVAAAASVGVTAGKLLARRRRRASAFSHLRLG